ncbi:Sin-like protein conserved region-domain-containing protein [Kalaharituber pfeilii]|nr:Sin-like protein conserved region-domain-containing protein [Kalaharituber pfeilii]
MPRGRRPPQTPKARSLFIEADSDAPSDEVGGHAGPAVARLCSLPHGRTHHGDLSDADAHSGEDDDAGSTTTGDDDDPVVRTYDVHLTTTLSPYLYLFQYPVRGKHLPFSKLTGSCPVAARIKPESGLLEVDVPINTYKNYDQDKGRMWGEALQKAKLEREARISGAAGPAGSGRAGAGAGVGGAKRRRVGAQEDEGEDEDDIMHVSFQEALAKGRVLSKQTLGAKIQPDSTNYMIGVFRNNQLHLTPLHSTIQLRPQFNHIDTAAELERNLTRSLRLDPAAAGPPTARALHATVKASDESAAAADHSSVMKTLRREEGEEWKTLSWVDQDDAEAWEVFEGMFLDGVEGVKKEEVEEEEEEEEEKEGSKEQVEGGETKDAEGDVEMVRDDGTKSGEKKNPKPVLEGKNQTKVPVLRTTVSAAEYLHMLAMPRVGKDG